MFREKSSIDKKYDSIWSYERSWAYSLAASIKDTRPISVWEVIMPVFLIFNFVKNKGDRDFLANNFMFTKELALSAAYDMVKKDRTRRLAFKPVESKTARLIELDSHGLYSEEIRQSQHREIEFLMDHYLRLMKAQGLDYKSLVASAYPNRSEMEDFIERLSLLESQVNRAALNTLGSKGNPEFVERVETHSGRIRLASLDRVY
jgi:hypothetical protein